MVSGDSTNAGSDGVAFARLNPDGSFDPTFAYRLDETGTPVYGWTLIGFDSIGIDPFYYDQLRSLTIQPNGGIVAAGMVAWGPHAYNAYPIDELHVGMGALRLNPDGTLDTSFGNYPLSPGSGGGGVFFNGLPPWVHEDPTRRTRRTRSPSSATASTPPTRPTRPTTSSSSSGGSAAIRRSTRPPTSSSSD